MSQVWVIIIQFVKIFELSHPKSNEHMDETSDSDICDHNVMPSDIPDKSDN